MLVRAFEIERGRPFELRPLLEHEGMGRAGIEPDVEDVLDLLVFGRVVGVAEEVAPARVNQASAPSARTRRRCARPPPDRAAARRSSCRRRSRAARPRRAGARCTNRAGSRPSRDAVAGPAAGSSGSSSIAASAFCAQAVRLHADEPLRRGAEDHRRLRPPGVRIGMVERAARQEAAGRVDRGDHRVVGVARLAVRAGRPAGRRTAARSADRRRPARPSPAPAGRSPGRARNRRRRGRARCGRSRCRRPRQSRPASSGTSNS